MADTATVVGIGLGVAVVSALAVLIAVLFWRLQKARIELGARVDDADHAIHGVKRDLRDYADELDEQVTTGHVSAASVDARSVHASSVDAGAVHASSVDSSGRVRAGDVVASKSVTADSINATHVVRAGQLLVNGHAMLSMAPPSGETAAHLPPRHGGTPHGSMMKAMPHHAAPAPAPKPAPKPVPKPAPKPVPKPAPKPAAAAKASTKAPPSRPIVAVQPKREPFYGGAGAGSCQHHGKHHHDDESSDDDHHEHHEHHHHKFVHPGHGHENVSWLSMLSGAAATGTHHPGGGSTAGSHHPPAAGSHHPPAAGSAVSHHPPGGSAAGAKPAAAKPAAPEDQWMYMTDPTGSRLFQGGLAASTAWFRDGMQLAPGTCIKDSSADGGAVCFASSGADRVVRVWDTLQAQSIKVGGGDGSGPAAMLTHMAPNKEAPRGALLVDTSFGVRGKMQVAEDAEFDGLATFNGPAKFARGAEATTGGFIASGPPGSAPIASRKGGGGLADEAKGGGVRMFAATTTANPQVHMSFLSKDGKAMSDALSVSPDGSIRSAHLMTDAHRGAWLGAHAAAAATPWSDAGVHLESAPVPGENKWASTGAGVKLGGGTTSASEWRAGVWQKANAFDRFVLERAVHGAKGATAVPVLTATSGGLGVMVPAGRDPKSALDVVGDVRLSGRLCVGEACIAPKDMTAISSLPAKQAALSDKVASQASAITAQGSKITAQGGVINAQGSKITSQGSQITSQGSQITSQADQIASQANQIANQNNVLSAQDSKLTNQSAALSQTNAQIAQMQTQIAALQAAIAAGPPAAAGAASAGSVGGGSAAQQQQPQQPPMLDYDASALPSTLVGTPVTSWPNTGALGSSYAAMGAGSSVPTLKSDGFGKYVSMTASGYMAVQGSVAWTLQSSGASFVALMVARVNSAPGASTLLEFGAGALNNALLLSEDGSGQLTGSFYAAGSPAAATSTASPGGVVQSGKWAVYGVRISPSAGGYTIALYVNGVVAVTTGGTAQLSDRVTSTNLINQSSAGGQGAAIDLAELQMFNAVMTDAQVAAASQALATKWAVAAQ